MLIVQGNCYDTYMRWTEYVLKEIPTELQSHIAGVAMAGAALGTGFLEDIERVAYVPYLPFETNYLHILGVGSVKRLIPLLALLRSGYFQKDMQISYDSTTHTMGLAVGRYCLGEKSIDIFRHVDQNYLNIYNDMNSKYDLEGQGIDMKVFHKCVNSAGEYYTDDKNYVDIKANEYYNIKSGYVSSSIENFTRMIDECYQSEKVLLRVAEKNRVLIEAVALLRIKTLEEFQNWEKEYGKHVHSRRISNIELSTLESFM
jgi:hypothetical protein